MVNDINVLWYNIEVTTTTFYMADSYTVVLPLSGQPPDFNLNFLATAVPMRVTIWMGFPADPDNFSIGELTQMIVGNVDKLDIDPLSKTVSFTGRDLTSLFIDTKTYDKYADQTASQIATQLAQQQGLGTSLIVPTTTPVGTFYTYQNTLMTRETTQWDLLTFIAQQEDNVVYVQGNDLVFIPRPTVNTSVPFVLNYQSGNPTQASPSYPGMSLKLTRSLTLAANVTVKVRVPANPQTGKAFTRTVTSSHTSSGSVQNQIYSYTFPGLNPSQALARAQQLLRDITLHEIKLNTSIPGEVKLTKDSLIQLTGTNTNLDQVYFTDMIVRSMSVDSEIGFHETISAKNHSVETQVLL